MTSSTVVTITTENFTAEVLAPAGPVFVFFWAEWCGPCKTLGPFLEELADQYCGRVRIGKVNIDEQPALAGEYGIRAVPTLLLLRRGQIADQVVGLHSRRELEESLGQAMS